MVSCGPEDLSRFPTSLPAESLRLRMLLFAAPRPMPANDERLLPPSVLLLPPPLLLPPSLLPPPPLVPLSPLRLLLLPLLLTLRVLLPLLPVAVYLSWKGV